mgnify:CR=1 FL=1
MGSPAEQVRVNSDFSTTPFKAKIGNAGTGFVHLQHNGPAGARRYGHGELTR